MIKLFLTLSLVLISGLCLGADVVVDGAIPYKPDSHDTEGLIFKIILSFIAVSMLAYFIVFILKKYFYGMHLQQKQESKMLLHEMKRISPRLTLLRVELNGKEIYLAQTENSLVILDREEISNNNEEINPNTDN